MPPKSKNKRQIYVRTPGNRVTQHFHRKKPQPAHCNGCGDTLKGVPRLSVAKIRQLPKSQRRPERPYGGMLCSRCSRIRIKTEAQSF